MNVADYLVRWSPNIVEATADDIARFGPNAAQVLGLLNYLPTMSDDGAEATYRMWRTPLNAADDAAWNAAWDASWDAASATARNAEMRAADDAAWNAARDASWDTARTAAKNAARAEVVSDLITPEQYRLLTNPLNIGRTYQERMGLMLPDQQGPFMQMINQLRPASAEDVLAIERLSGNPNVNALLEMLGGMAEGQSLARRIKAAETMYRAGREGRRGIV
jgi:hypothetical protein